MHIDNQRGYTFHQIFPNPTCPENDFTLSPYSYIMAISLARRNQKLIYFPVESDREWGIIGRIKRQTDEKEYAAIGERLIIDDT